MTESEHRHLKPVYATHDIHGNELTAEDRKTLRENQPELESFRKSNWKTAMSRDSLAPLMQQAAKARHEAEWRSIIDDRTDREVTVVHIDDSNREQWEKRIDENDLVCREIRYIEPYEGHVHKVREASADDPDKITYAAIAKTSDAADKIVEAETEIHTGERHRIVGELLGYPDCCIDFFLEKWHEEELMDPIYETACNTTTAERVGGDPHTIRIVDPEPWANTLWRYFNWAFITHIPCAFDCKQSQEIAETRGQIMADNGYRDAANQLYQWLSLPHTWSGLKGLALIKNEHIICSAQTSCYWNKKRVIWGEEHPNEAVSVPGPEEDSQAVEADAPRLDLGEEADTR